jgi:hypothetical protein
MNPQRPILTTPNTPLHTRGALPPVPPGMSIVLYSSQSKRILFDKNLNRFLFRVRDDEWVRFYGLSKVMQHAFWPDYDRNSPTIVAGEKELRSKHAKLRKRQRRKKAPARGGSGTYTDEQVRSMQNEPQRDTATGTELGSLVHMQLVIWAKKRMLRESLDTSAMVPRWQGHTQLAVSELVGNVGVDVRYGEFLVYDPTVPVATAIDLVGWLPRPESRQLLRKYVAVNKEPSFITEQRGNEWTVVVIEVKTGSSYNMNLGNAAMRGKTARELHLHNSPLNQALTQLAISRAIVEERYTAVPKDTGDGNNNNGQPSGIQRRVRVLGLLVWVNRAVGARSKWLSLSWEEAGRLMLGELRVHMAERGGKAWKPPVL